MGKKPIIALNKVDLPAPFIPTSALIVPVGILKFALRRAVLPFRYVTVTS
jgi:hypothetical protein